MVIISVTRRVKLYCWETQQILLVLFFMTKQYFRDLGSKRFGLKLMSSLT